jgi:hypothetical protein
MDAAMIAQEPRLHIEAEDIATLRYEGIRYADKRSRKLQFGGAAYTPEFRQLSVTVKTLDLLIAKREKN